MILFTSIANFFRKEKKCPKCGRPLELSWFHGPLVCRECDWSMPTRRFFKHHNWVKIAIEKGRNSSWGK